MTHENSSYRQRQRLRLSLVSRCGMPQLKNLFCQLTYRRLTIYIGAIFRFSIHFEILVLFHLIVPEEGTTTIMAFMKNILSFNLNCTTLSKHYSKFFRKCLRQGFLSADVYSEKFPDSRC